MELEGAFENGMPFLAIRVAGQEYRALMDTGYDGFVMLSREEIGRLKLKELGKSVYRTADGQLHEGRIYRGRAEWLGAAQESAIDSTEGDFVLVGMKLLQPLRLVMEPSRRILVLSTINSN